MNGNTNYAMNMAIIKIIECTTFVKKNMEKHAETEGEEQQETTTVNDDENTKYEERQQTEVLTENDKIEDTDEQPELKDGDDEDNLTHSMSLNKKITSGNAKKIKRRQKGLQKSLQKSLQKRKETKLQVILLNDRHQNQQKQIEILHQHNLKLQSF
ncbi:unnamed protein product [Mytilus edulis]|uniref:Uncharacterized protein n=1 Tax=Mytilus edulis TaxID=6550 RepID=A0A8S3QSG7_MYTED|nr:unnamed protein product [Mytilus edulis]